MFARRQSHQIAEAIISLDSVQMVNYPPLWEGFAISLLPNKDMLQDIALTGSRVLRFKKVHITIGANKSTPFPCRTIFSGLSFQPNYIELLSTFTASFRTWVASCRDRFSTINAEISSFFMGYPGLSLPPEYLAASLASQDPNVTWLPTVNTGMLLPFPPTLDSGGVLIHTYSIPQNVYAGQYV